MGEYTKYTAEIDNFIVETVEKGDYPSKAAAFRDIADTLDLRETQIQARYYKLRPVQEGEGQRTRYTPEMDAFIFKEGLHPKGKTTDNFKRIAKEMGLKAGAVQARFYDMAANRLPRPKGFEDYEYNYKRTPSKRTQKSLQKKEEETVQAEMELGNGHQLQGYRYVPARGKGSTPLSIIADRFLADEISAAEQEWNEDVHRIADIDVIADTNVETFLKQRESDLEACRIKARYDALNEIRSELILEQVKFISDDKLMELVNELNKELYKRLKNEA